jgi:hypothetical protein
LLNRATDKVSGKGRVQITAWPGPTIVLTSEFAQKYDMNFRFSSIPMDYPFRGPLDFQPSSMRVLFDYGVECAQEGRLWTTVEQATTRGRAVIPVGFDGRRASDPQMTPPCPLNTLAVPLQSTAQLR